MSHSVSYTKTRFERSAIWPKTYSLWRWFSERRSLRDVQSSMVTGLLYDSMQMHGVLYTQYNVFLCIMRYSQTQYFL